MISKLLDEVEAGATPELVDNPEKQAQLYDLIDTLPRDSLEWHQLYQCIATMRAARRFPNSGMGTQEGALKALQTTLKFLKRTQENQDK